MKIEEEEELLKNLKSKVQKIFFIFIDFFIFIVKVQKIDDNMMNDCHTKINWIRSPETAGTRKVTQWSPWKQWAGEKDLKFIRIPFIDISKNTPVRLLPKKEQSSLQFVASCILNYLFRGQIFFHEEGIRTRMPQYMIFGWYW